MIAMEFHEAAELLAAIAKAQNGDPTSGGGL